MNTEDLFKYGVTPKEGEFAGKRFAVSAVKPGGVDVHPWEKAEELAFFSHGSYEIWHEPKTLFEDDSIPATWGNLKKAMKKAGLGDDTRFAVPLPPPFGYEQAEFEVKKLTVGDDKEKKNVIVVY